MPRFGELASLILKSKGIHIDPSKHPICAKDDDIQCFVSYLRMISTHRVNFDRAVDSFIVFSDVSDLFGKIRGRTRI